MNIIAGLVLVREAPNLHWTEVPLGDWLSKALGGRRVEVGNNAELSEIGRAHV